MYKLQFVITIHSHTDNQEVAYMDAAEIADFLYAEAEVYDEAPDITFTVDRFECIPDYLVEEDDYELDPHGYFDIDVDITDEDGV